LEEVFILRGIIVANGDLNYSTEDLSYLNQIEIIMAANGGVQNCFTLGIKPSIVIGDLDSLTLDQQENLKSSNTRFIEYPKDKDQTDLELALKHAKELGINEVFLLGLFGGRLDQSFANLLLLTRKEFQGFKFTAFNGQEIAYLIQNKGFLTINGNPGNIISLIPLTTQVTEIYTDSLRWPLKGGQLVFGSTLGISNEMLNTSCTIQIGSGNLLVIHTKCQPLE
jgi:thiamine pyrophosphokinase